MEPAPWRNRYQSRATPTPGARTCPRHGSPGLRAGVVLDHLGFECERDCRGCVDSTTPRSNRRVISSLPKAVVEAGIARARSQDQIGVLVGWPGADLARDAARHVIGQHIPVVHGARFLLVGGRIVVGTRNIQRQASAQQHRQCCRRERAPGGSVEDSCAHAPCHVVMPSSCIASS